MLYRVKKKKLAIFLILLIFTSIIGNFILYQKSAGYFISYGCGHSMEPAYQPGDVFVSTGVYSSIEKDDVVRYIDNNGTSVYHRVIKVNKSRENSYLIKGDNNEKVDGWYSKDKIEAKIVVHKIVNVKEIC